MSNWDWASDKLNPSAVWYAKNGWNIFPCAGIVNGKCSCNNPHPDPKDTGKHPTIAAWNVEATSDLDQITKWWKTWPDANIGLQCRESGFMVIDIDPRSGGIDSFEQFQELIGVELPPTVEALTGNYIIGDEQLTRGRHIFFKCDESEKLIGNLGKEGIKGIDIKHNGYVIVSPSRHFSGVCYEWAEGKAPWQIEMAQAPDELLKVIRKKSNKSSTSLADGDWTWVKDLEFNGEKINLEKMLEEGIDEGSRAVDIYKMTCALSNKIGVNNDFGKIQVETLMIRFNAEKVRPPLNLEGSNGLLQHVRNAIDYISKNPKTERMWPSITEFQQDWAKKSEEEARSNTKLTALTGVVQPASYVDTFNQTHISKSISESMEDGDSILQASGNSNVNVPKDPDALREEEGGEPGKRSFSDTGNGRRLVDSFGAGIRYTEGIGWFHWDEEYWKPDVEKLEIQELAKKLSRYIAGEIVKYDDTDAQTNVIKWAQQAKSNTRIKGAIENANSDPRIRVPVERWDSHENYLGVRNGVVDLRTGELLKGKADLYITRRAPVGYNRGQTNTRWQQFLDFATGGDKEFQDWIQRAAGYSLTGSSKYDVMFLVYGPPGSGKNTLVEAIVKCLGTSQYAWPMSTDVLSGDTQNNSDQYHWAELRGRRVVWIDELPDSERLKESAVKKLTGSSEVSARSPGERPFSFQSQAKLWLTTNHRPIITDDAMWRRIRPIPLTRVPEVPDPGLKEYIFDEDGGLPAVLSWAVEGAIKVLGSASRDALGWCSVVSEAASIYRKNEDRIGLFLAEETKEADGASTPIRNLYTVYRVWSDERGEKAMTQIAFFRKLSERGLKVDGSGTRAIINGFSLVPRAVPSGEVDWGLAVRSAKF